jgi:hypothetical protein
MVRLRAWLGALALLSVAAAACGSSGGSNDGSADGSSAGEKGGGGAAGKGGLGGAGGPTDGRAGAIGEAGAAGGAGAAGRGAAGSGGGLGTGEGATTGGGGTISAGTSGSVGGAGLSGTGGATGTAGSGGTATGGAAGGTSTVANCGAASTLVDSSDTLIDLFVVQSGIIVVDASSVSLYGRDGKVIKAVPFARQITAAAFDGTTLVIADEAELTVMSSALTVGPTGFLTVSCAAAVLVGENHFVCGPANDWQRTFLTYDIGMNPPAQIATSAEYTYNGIPMQRVPGTDEFVTVTLDTEPPSFYLFQVAADTGTTVFEGGSPFDTYDADLVFAFDGAPATHMIQDQGDILALTGTGCQNGIDSLEGTCFAQTGVLGTLRTGQGLIGLGDDGAGRLVGVVSPSSNTYPFGSPCAGGCPVQLIDIASRSILQQQSYTIADLSALVRTTYDPYCGNAVLGYSKIDSTDDLDSSGYRVQALAF